MCVALLGRRAIEAHTRLAQQDSPHRPLTLNPLD
jgi:hypothetical protein